MAGFDLVAYRATEPPDDMARWYKVRIAVDRDENGNPYDVIIRIPHINRWPARAVDVLMQPGQFGNALRIAIGDAQVNLLDEYEVTHGQREAIFDDWGKYSGFRPGRPSSPAFEQEPTPKLDSPSNGHTESTYATPT